jgi:outer membrane protein assembly factor BamD (BamD/ComL family)
MDSEHASDHEGPAPESAADWLDRAAAAAAAADWTGARSAYEVALRLAPQDPVAAVGLRRAQWEEWLATVYQMAEAALQAGRLAAAVAMLDRVLEHQPTYRDAAELRQQAQERLDTDRALAEWYDSGVAALRCGEARAAADAFREIVGHRPDYRDAARQLAAALAALERKQAAWKMRSHLAHSTTSEHVPPRHVPSTGEPLTRGGTPRPSASSTSKVIVGRRAVLDALYQQGIRALHRREYFAAIDALEPVAAEAPELYPEVRARLLEAQRGAGRLPADAVSPR